MNYGGAGQYGQPPMAGQQPMPHGMAAAAANQQRMMMAQNPGMRPGGPMYNQPPMGQPGMMGPQGGMNPMYPHGYSAMQAPGPAQMRMPQPPIDQNQYQAILQKMPEEWRTQIQKEANTERKKQLFQFYLHKLRQYHQQGSVPPNMVHGQGGMPPYGQMPGGPQPHVMAQPGMNKPLQGGPPQNMPQHPGHPAMRMGGPLGPQPGMPPASGAGPVQPQNQHLLAAQQQQHTVPSPQVASLSSQQPVATGSPMMVPHGMSPQVVAQQPATPQNPSSVQQPGSVGDVPQPSSVGQSERTPEYDTLLKELRDKYYDQLKKVDERCSMDNTPKPKGFDRLMEVIDNKRVVTYELLQRVYNSTLSMLEKQALSFPILEEVRKIGEPLKENKDGQGQAKQPEEKETPSPGKAYPVDPWKPIRHMMIKVPDLVLKAVDEPSTRKRRSDESPAAEDVVPPKVTKPEPTLPPLVASKSVAKTNVDPKLFDAFGERIADSVEEDEDAGNNGDDGERIEIPCIGNGRKWKLSVEASQELTGLPWRPDPEAMPQSWRSPDVVICFDALTLMCPPLRVLVPAKYPEEQAVIQFDRSFPDGPMSKRMAAIFERTLSLYPGRSLTNIYDSFKTACQEVNRLKSFTGHYVPNEHQQKQLVA